MAKKNKVEQGKKQGRVGLSIDDSLFPRLLIYSKPSHAHAHSSYI